MTPRCRTFEMRGYYIYIIYTPNLGLEIVVPGQEREQGRFRGSNKGVRGSNKRAEGSTKRLGRSNKGARGSTVGQCRGAAGGSLK